MSERNTSSSAGHPPRSARAERLAKALRANLQRRKQQARGRGAEQEDTSPAPAARRNAPDASGG